MTHEVLKVFDIFAEEEDEDFVNSDDFADDVARVVRVITASGIYTEDAINTAAELLFSIAAKIKLHPKYLPVWFRPSSGKHRQESEVQKSQAWGGKGDFPLFQFFLSYIHLDSRAGEFSRTGLIYTIEFSDGDEALERWIIESDLATLMASGLGALYSQLSRKLVSGHGEVPLPAVFALSNAQQPAVNRAIDHSASEEFHKDLQAFLMLLAFWQDILEYCGSVDIRQSLLDHFEHIFLQQVLYPSMLESSDQDGGSSVATVTYIRLILESVTHPDLIRVFLRFLLASHTKSVQSSDTKSARPAALARRRKSQNLLDAEAQDQDRLVPDLFSLGDLIISSLRSSDQQTVSSTLKLTSTILQNQYQHTMSPLLLAQPIAEGLNKYPMDMQERVLNHLQDLCVQIGRSDDLPELTDATYEDMQNLIESHCTTNPTLRLPSQFDDNQTVLPLHVLSDRSPFLYSLISLLQRYFANDIEINLLLTNTIIQLCCCGRCSLKGWLLDHAHPAESNRPSVSGASYPSPRQSPPLSPLPGFDDSNVTEGSIPNSVIINALNALSTQVSTFRSQIPNFDNQVSEQKHAFTVWEQMSKTRSTPPSPRKSSESSRRNQSAANNLLISLPSRLRPSEQSSLNPSRSGSPRGRRSADFVATSGGAVAAASRNLTNRPGQLQERPSSSPSPLRFNPQTNRVPLAATPIGIGGALPDTKVKVIVPGKASGQEDDKKEKLTKEVPLRQVLTNVVILEGFIMELMALLEVRARLFGEVVMD